ncbi:ZIP-like iron-zinc transporter [Amylocystis lapponica]|nr:ZIP-like iron-zinc transporter [Amylocystis lapponica]
MSDDVYCGSGGGANTYFGLRVASVFIILATSMTGALFPVLAKRTKWLNDLIPPLALQIAKYFASGVIIATAFIHLLDPAMAELSSPCLSPEWLNYPYALGISLCSIFTIFITELVAFRWGTAKLAKLGITHDAHGHGMPSQHAAHGPEGAGPVVESKTIESEEKDFTGAPDVETGPVGSIADSATAQIIGVAILEFGVLLHSILIGLTLAVDPSFKILFVVIVFHQMFEGLGVGSRLAYMRLPPAYNYIPVVGACLYGITTPIGIAAGLGVRTTYNPNSPTASIVSGVLDAFSSGILIYTGLVELIAHEFVFNREMMEASNGKLALALGVMMLGAGLMALLGRWA